MNDYTLGLDIGITSVGWGIIDKNSKTIACGVRLFEEASSDNNVKRREKRSSRRIKRRRNQRVIEMKRLLLQKGIIDKDFHTLDNPYELRVKGLKTTLTNNELATVLLHLAKRRGSSLEVVLDESESNKEDQALKETLQENSNLLVLPPSRILLYKTK